MTGDIPALKVEEKVKLSGVWIVSVGLKADGGGGRNMAVAGVAKGKKGLMWDK